MSTTIRPLNAARLREKVTIEQETRTPNGQGGFTTTWSTLATPYAEVIGLSGTEALKANVERDVQQWRVMIRKRKDITARHRLQWQGLPNVSKVLNIKSVMPDPESPMEGLIMMCESGGGSV